MSGGDVLVHLVTEGAWAELRRTPHGTIGPSAGGFVHLSTHRQVPVAANRHFPGRGDLVLLVLDGPAVAAGDLRWEPGDPPEGELRFPHLYGHLPLDAVVSAHRYRSGPDGVFGTPEMGPGTRVAGGP